MVGRDWYEERMEYIRMGMDVPEKELHTFFVEWKYEFEDEDGEWEQGDSELIRAYDEDEAMDTFECEMVGKDGIPEGAVIVGCEDHGVW